MRMWELRQNGVPSAPIGESDLEAMLAAGTIEGTVAVRPVGKDAWKPAMRHAPFASAAQRAPRREGTMAPTSTGAPAPHKDPLRWDQQTQLNMPAQPPAALLAPAAGPAPGSHRAMAAQQPPMAGFSAGLFDFSFTTFVTPRVARAFYVLFVIGLGLGTLVGMLNGLIAVVASGESQSDAARAFGLVQLTTAPVLALFFLTLGRMVFESIVVFFRIAEHLAEINRKTVG